MTTPQESRSEVDDSGLKKKKKPARKRLEKSALLHGQTETITAMDFRVAGD